MTRSPRPHPGPHSPPTGGDADPAESFAARWSRRKHAARETPLAVDSPPQAAGTAAPGMPRDASPDAHAPAVEAQPPGDEDMPPLESLGADSDVSAFFSPRVSEKLRRLALQRIFRTPKFNFRDGLDDYDGDYRNFEPLGDVMTADLRHRLEMEAERTRQRLAEGEAAREQLDAADGVDVAQPDTRRDVPQDTGAVDGHLAGRTSAAESQRADTPGHTDTAPAPAAEPPPEQEVPS